MAAHEPRFLRLGMHKLTPGCDLHADSRQAWSETSRTLVNNRSPKFRAGAFPPPQCHTFGFTTRTYLRTILCILKMPPGPSSSSRDRQYGGSILPSSIISPPQTAAGHSSRPAEDEEVLHQTQNTGGPRRRSDDSENTVYERDDDPITFSSYRHPFDIQPPLPAYGSTDHRDSDKVPTQIRRRRRWDEENGTPFVEQPIRRGSFGSELNNEYHSQTGLELDGIVASELFDVSTDSRSPRMDKAEWLESDLSGSEGSQASDDDDGDDDDGDRDHSRMTELRAVHRTEPLIERRKLVLNFARALMAFGAPSHRIHSQLVALCRVLAVDHSDFILIYGVTLVFFTDLENDSSEDHIVKCTGRLELCNLHEVHTIYRSIIHEEENTSTANERLECLLKAPPIYSRLQRCILAFGLSGLICPLAFGGSFVDMWIAGLAGASLCILQVTVFPKGVLMGNILEVAIAFCISFAARGLSSIKGDLFCYSAIASAAIVGVLPGYLILNSSLDLAYKNIMCGSIRLVYALVYTLFLGFGLRIGSDFFLLLDSPERHKLLMLSNEIHGSIAYNGTFLSDNSSRFGDGKALYGTFTFSNSTTSNHDHIFKGCYRPTDEHWYLRIFPWWTQLFMVPAFAICSSMLNLQPWKSKEMVVMVVIACVAWTANAVVGHYINKRSDYVSFVAALVVGLIGNIYSRRMGGTAFTSMVTGVLFLVPSGLAQDEGITGGRSVDVGGGMLSIAMGTTVGLMMSQAVVYAFGRKKNGGMFTF
ncbi:hypothetical protein EW146_g946 [Bondarzewia mesenterica]|uniref:Threonine/serine exporter-like N-terminal domain-containing protein n=1 Tax=Bondarzewia mesenterica TaxID=1095465 RepID=A0A4S4M773_9AGAM|nr:hypothetical protein EW146_g946 [Bondarzewia mesenterica]